MINFKNVKLYCSEDISLIENYEQAMHDKNKTWACHHRGEILPCGTFSVIDLQTFGLYYNRPASELIFLTPSKHQSLHNRNLSKNTLDKKRISMLGKISGMKGKHHSEETKKKLSKANSGENNPNFGKHHSEEHKLMISDLTKIAMNRPEVKEKMSKIRTGVKQKPETIEKRMLKIRGTHRSKQWKKAIEQKEQIQNLYHSGLCFFRIEKLLGIDHKIVKSIIIS